MLTPNLSPYAKNGRLVAASQKRQVRPLSPLISCLPFPSYIICLPSTNLLQVLRRHSDLGYTAALLNPAAIRNYLGPIKLPGGIAADEWDGFHDLVVTDEMARCGSLGVLWALGCGNVIGCPPIINFGTEEQKSQFLSPVLRGETRFCLGITEPGGELASFLSSFLCNCRRSWMTGTC
jgi:hypothetical protein